MSHSLHPRAAFSPLPRRWNRHFEIDPASFHKKLEQRLPQYKGRWKSSMADQIQDLPDFDQVVRELMRHLKNLELGATK